VSDASGFRISAEIISAAAKRQMRVVLRSRLAAAKRQMRVVLRSRLAAAKRQMRVVLRSRLARAYDLAVVERIMTNLL
jgi:hypothetical protein